MRASFQKKMIFKSIVVALLVISALIVNSCRKDNKQSSVNHPLVMSINANIPTLKVIYNNSIINTKIQFSNHSSINVNLIRTLDVNWNTYTLQKRKDSSIVAEFDMNNDTSLFTLKKINPGDTLKFINKTTVTFIRFKNGNQLNFFTKVIEDLTSSGKHFVMNSITLRAGTA